MHPPYSQVVIVDELRIADTFKGILHKHYPQLPIHCIDAHAAKSEIDAYFAQLSGALIVNVSAYIYQQSAIEANTIINYHNSLLPLHRGMYAHIWAIFQGDTYTGITWHMVTPQIDQGDILVQKRLPITTKTTALQLRIALHQLAINSLDEALSNLDQGHTTPQDLMAVADCATIKAPQMHYRKDLPNHGFLDLTQDEETCQHFLAAFNYGLFTKMRPRLQCGQQEFVITKATLQEHLLKIICAGGLTLEYKFPTEIKTEDSSLKSR